MAGQHVERQQQHRLRRAGDGKLLTKSRTLVAVINAADFSLHSDARTHTEPTAKRGGRWLGGKRSVRLNDALKDSRRRKSWKEKGHCARRFYSFDPHTSLTEGLHLCHYCCTDSTLHSHRLALKRALYKTLQRPLNLSPRRHVSSTMTSSFPEELFALQSAIRSVARTSEAVVDVEQDYNAKSIDTGGTKGKLNRNEGQT